MATDSMLRPGELKDILLKEIAAADLGSLDVDDVGTVLEVKDGVALIYGLKQAIAGEMLEFTVRESGEVITGLVLNLEQDSVGAAIMGDYLKLKEGDEVRCTGRLLEVPSRPPACWAGWSTPWASRWTVSVRSRPTAPVRSR